MVVDSSSLIRWIFFPPELLRFSVKFPGSPLSILWQKSCRCCCIGVYAAAACKWCDRCVTWRGRQDCIEFLRVFQRLFSLEVWKVYPLDVHVFWKSIEAPTCTTILYPTHLYPTPPLPLYGMTFLLFEVVFCLSVSSRNIVPNTFQNDLRNCRKLADDIETVSADDIHINTPKDV